jgi:membrane associated rhomboid family serine protease
MLYLWVFGNNVEDRMGRVRYVLFYFICGFAAAAAHFLVSSSSPVPVVGASGAISGVLGAYLVLYPRAPVVSLVPIFLFWTVELPAVVVLGFWFVLQLAQAVLGLGATRGGGVAFFAHVGGFVAGVALVRSFARVRRRPDPLEPYLA